MAILKLMRGLDGWVLQQLGVLQIWHKPFYMSGSCTQLPKALRYFQNQGSYTSWAKKFHDF